MPKEIPIFEVLLKGKLKGDNQDSILIHRDGRRFNISTNCAPIRDKTGRIIGSILVFRDISEEFAAKTILEKAKENAELANKAKDSFLATMSHEIRTPLSALIGMLELLSKTVLSIDQKSMVQNALESGNSLLRILSDILDWSKIEEGKLELSLQPTSISRLLSEVVKTYSHIASSKGLSLISTIDENISNAHLVDPLRLSQILNNFVSNGIKFTPKGNITVSADLVKNLSHAQQIRFSVTDTGIGLSKKDQSRLFQSYSQATADTDGYALTKEIRNIESSRYRTRTPIIAYTANVLSEENENCFSVGMDEILIKPARLNVLRQTLIRWVPTLVNPIENDSPDTFHNSRSPIDTKELSSIVADKTEQISILKKFRTHHQNDLAKLIDELSKKNLIEAAHLAHRLKGSSKIAGARDLVNGYLKIESFIKENEIDNALKEIELMKDDILSVDSFIDRL